MLKLSITACEMAWPAHDDVSPVPLTPNRSPLSSVGGCGVEPGELRSSVSPDPASSSSPGVTPAGCASSGSVQLSAGSCLRGADDSPLLSAVQCRLETKDLWDKFYELGTEMIITKSGRSAVCL